MDAEIIARYGHVMHPAGWVPPRTVSSDLRQLTRERETVQLHWIQEHNHLTALQDAQQVSGTVLALVQRRIDPLEQQVVELEDALHTLMDTDASLKQQLTLLLSVPGYGFIAAATVLAETAGFSRLETGSELSAAAGMAPAPNQSGASTKRGSISKVGNLRLRRIAYLAALGATRSNSRMRVFYQGLKARGKPPKVALIALGRKLLTTGLAVVRSGKPYQDDFSRAQDGSGPTPHAAVQGVDNSTPRPYPAGSSGRGGNAGSSVMVEVFHEGVQVQKFLCSLSPLEPMLLSFLTPCKTVRLFNHVVPACRGDHLLVIDVSQARNASDRSSTAS